MVSIEVQSSYATEFLPISMPIVQLRAASMIWDNRYLFNVLLLLSSPWDMFY